MIEFYHKDGSRCVGEIKDDCLLYFISDVNNLLMRHSGVSVYLFGSRIWRNYEPNSNSDLDVCISCKDNIEYILFETELKNIYSPYVLDIKRVETMTTKELTKDIIDNGLKLGQHSLLNS